MSRDIIHPVGYFGRKKYFYLCEDCGEAILQRLDVIKGLQNTRCRACSNRRKGKENRDKIRDATLIQMQSGNWRLNSLTEEEIKRMVINTHRTLKKMHASGELVAWNKGTHTQTNTGRTHFKKGHVPASYIDGRSKLDSLVHGQLYSIWIRPILKRDNWKCQYCGSTSNLHVHHDKVRMKEIYDRFDIRDNLGINEKRKLALSIAQYHVDNNVSGITLCMKCHIKVHKEENHHDR